HHISKLRGRQSGCPRAATQSAGALLAASTFQGLATRMDLAGLWQQAGLIGDLQCGGQWWSAVPVEEWPDDPDFTSEMEEISVEPYGDRRQEIVVIGHDLEEADFRRRLNQCLLTDEEFAAGPDVWAGYDDPIPEWTLMEDGDHHDHSHSH
ncbi:MAG: hypothetical protein CMJ77_20000, partial [Planctomycetaceae bacterium]|nr:hypothetical protein [Planctomycetaceae bacterium]